MTTARDTLLDTLRRDLIGPASDDEELIRAWPSDQYVAGILYPEAAPAVADEVQAEDDDGRDAPDDSDDAASPAIPTSQMRRPTLMGISFAVEGEHPVLRVRATAARYEPEGDGDGHHPASWRRRPVELDVELPVTDGLVPHVAVGELTWWVRAVRSGARWQVTVVLANTAKHAPGRVQAERATWFQVGFEVRAGAACRLVPRLTSGRGGDDDQQINALIYRDAREWAVGHTCAADWRTDGGTPIVSATWLPTQRVAAMNADGHPYFLEEAARSGMVGALDAEALADASSPAALRRLLDVLPAAYERWQTELAGRVAREESSGSLSRADAERATGNLAVAAEVLRRIRRGIDVVTADDADVPRRAFQLAQRAMLLQRQWGEENRGALQWRPFQLAFFLMSLESLVHPVTSEGAVTAERLTMDLLWFPTGGGKTEAYLALTAFVLFLRRLREVDPDDGDGVAVLMRYTLRLLTTQQFERAARLVLACEHLRREFDRSGDPALGQAPFSIGLWVGQGATPNRVSDARTDADARKRAQQLVRCPACNARSLRWDIEPETKRFVVTCDQGGCLFHDTPLPVWTIDENVYSERPSLLIGTVDKFAQIVRNEQSHQILRGAKHPPELIIQDELHLISGPLGTVAGVYEAALDLICTNAGVPPKIVGSTATIRRARDQIRHLFDRDVMQFPPPGVDASDSCFAVVDDSAPGRLYAGITTAGRSPKFILQAVCASLVQGASEPSLRDQDRDAYWTLIAYFNSLRELGGALVMMQDDVQDSIQTYAAQHGTTPREVAEPVELTSRVSQADIPDLLVRLAERYDPARSQEDQEQATAVVLATNMLSVGVDIPRLGLMVVNGQPKTMSEYIQATSRVGRNRVAGLILTVYNSGRPRDCSHFEAFRTWHQTLYREVEATSVTPYASRARDRALHAAVVALARHLVDGMLSNPRLTAQRRQQLESRIDDLVERAGRADPDEKLLVRGEAMQFLDEWEKGSVPGHYWSDHQPAKSLLVSAELVAAAVAVDGVWRLQARGTLNSMRDVEPSVEFRMAKVLT